MGAPQKLGKLASKLKYISIKRERDLKSNLGPARETGLYLSRKGESNP